MKSKVCFAAFAVCLFSINLFSADNTWEGLNCSATGSTVTNIDDAASWSLGTVPGVGNSDSATILFQSYKRGAVQGELYVYATNQFNPRSLYFDASEGLDDWTQTSDLHIDKSLVLTNFVLKSGAQGSSGRVLDRFQLDMSDTGASLTIVGNNATFDMSDCDWAAFTSYGDVIFTATNIYFPGSTRADLYGGIRGAGSTHPCTMFFTNENSTITVEPRVGPAIYLAGMKFFARTNQVWNMDTNAYISMTAVGNGDFIGTPDEGAFNKMGEVNFQFVGSSGNNATMNFREGEYGSLKLTGTGKRTSNINSEGDVKFKAKFPGSDNSLYIRGYPNPYATNPNSTRTKFDMKGFNLFVQNSVYLEDYGVFTISDSDVYVGGDITIAPFDIYSGYYDGSVGIYGNENTELSFAGSYTVLGRAVSTADNLSKSTVSAVGGGVSNQFYEVCCSSNEFAVAAGTLAVDTFNVGLGTTNAYVTLTNAYWNNNPVVNTNETDRFGEKMLVNNLTIAADSTFDVNDLPVQITTSFDMEFSAILDLNISGDVETGNEITTFCGDGDQSVAWSAFEDQVINGSETTGFAAVYNVTDDKTYWKVSSAGGGTILIIQ